MMDFAFSAALITKIAFLILEILYIIFAIIVANQVGALNKLFYIEPAHSSRILQVISLIHILFAISLFMLTLVIL